MNNPLCRWLYHVAAITDDVTLTQHSV